VAFRDRAKARDDLAEWRRATAVLRYIEGRRAAAVAVELDAAVSSVYKWIRWYEVVGLEALHTRKAPGASPRLSREQQEELASIVEAGPLAAGFTSGMWTGPMVGQLIRDRYGVSYHEPVTPTPP
jgi:transposase